MGWALAIHGGAGTISNAARFADRHKHFEHALLRALEPGLSLLRDGASSLDAVEACVRALEDEPLFNAGRGAVLNTHGAFELDAAIMDGKDKRCGAVAGSRSTKNPVSLAREIMHNSPHVMLIGAAADRFAQAQNLQQVDARYFHTEARWDQFQRARRSAQLTLDHDTSDPTGTVGAVACDAWGDIAAATSTGGMTNQWSGRVGDSPLIGAGTYASNTSCAVSTTGTGEHFIRATVARDVAALMEYSNMALAEAAALKIHTDLADIGGKGGLIAGGPSWQSLALLQQYRHVPRLGGTGPRPPKRNFCQLTLVQQLSRDFFEHIEARVEARQNHDVIEASCLESVQAFAELRAGADEVDRT